MNPSSGIELQIIPMRDAEVIFYKNLFGKKEGDFLYEELQNTIHWRQDQMKFYGKAIDLPRLTAWYGDPGKTYTYSGIKMDSEVWTLELKQIKKKIEEVARVNFTSVLLNFYRSGRDSVSWHSDDEPELGKNPVIGSVSFGGTRQFQLRHKSVKTRARQERVLCRTEATGLGAARAREIVRLDLTHGSFLLMRGPTQHFWEHRIPKTSARVAPRINLTFRIL